uniref:Uncharacterized protein n=1 Tax=Chromera velia CCMP2878 TaxID=1169474 RepID=A0A0G4FDK5_9ALVE|eukprot:Cvel_16374.t1-p1 / transcript=Cvel_16374.t1 / gene=Cvel_16374 / organism=Chromera_velia_CCMP2878 / gene_product=hypothetical protein / transcript_product=hypothetical protein / location=Cvel_scaffold1258:50762-51422(+) / protein_length=165 / sequence_SO=supercontig / SO=protein_coding / is_pseudo=false
MVRAAIPVRGQSKSPKGGAAAAPSLPARAPSEGPKESPKVPSSFSLPPWYIFLSGVVQLFVASGVLHGFPSFRQMLLAEGYKRSLCPEEDELCDDRSRELLSIYTNSVVPATLGFLLAGFALPVLGPRFCNLLSLALHLVAHALMGMSGEDPEGIVPNRDWMASG